LNPTVSIVIASLNGRNLLGPCLRSLWDQTFTDFEVIVVDNGSTDGTVDFIKSFREPRLRMVSLSENRGFAGGCNAGMTQARGRYIATLNNDTEADRNWLGELVRVMDGNPKVGMGASKILFFNERNRIDKAGHLIHLGERDCTIQRNHQKLIEESPSPVVDAKLRRKMGDLAVRAAKAADYTTCGTVEFLVDQDRNFYFIEMNTRIQVEHPVTEMVTGIDLIKEQIRTASGEPLRMKQDDVALQGWAIECRVNAADPSNGFTPSPGRITAYHQPGGPGVRVDTHVFAGYEVPPFYDSMLAKLIVHGATRQEAIRVMQRALEEYLIEPLRTTIPLHRQIFSDPVFWRGYFSTDYLDTLLGAKE